MLRMIEVLCRVAVLLIATEALLLVLSTVLLGLAVASLIGVLALGGAGVALGVSLAGEQLHAVAVHLVGGTLLTITIFPVSGSKAAAYADQVTLVSVLAQVFRTLLPYNEVQEVRGILISGSLDRQRKGAAGGAGVSSAKFRLGSQSADN